MSEIIDIIDENDDVIGQMNRDEAQDQQKLFRTVSVLVINEAGELIVQWRSAAKKKNPRLFIASVAETVQAGETYEEAAIRGLKEELGITGVKVQELGLVKVREGDNPRNSMFYIADYSGDVSGWEEEAEVLDYWDADEADFMRQRFPYLLTDTFEAGLGLLFAKLDAQDEQKED